MAHSTHTDRPAVGDSRPAIEHQETFVWT